MVGRKPHHLPVLGVILGGDGAHGRCCLGVQMPGGVSEGVAIPATGSLARGVAFSFRWASIF